VGRRGQAHPVPDRTLALHHSDWSRGDLLARRHLRFHEDKRKRPTKNIQALLDHIEISGDPIFWG